MRVVDLTWLSYGIGAVVLYYGLLFSISLVPRWSPGGGPSPFFVFVVPARNEELVIARDTARLVGPATAA